MPAGDLTRTALDEIPDDTIEDVLLDRPIGGIRDLQYVYGKLYLLATGRGEDLWEACWTQDREDHLYGESEGLVRLHIDLTGDQPELVDVDAVKYTREQAGKLYYSYAKNTDLSLAQKSSSTGWSNDSFGEYAVRRIMNWVTADTADEIVSEYPTGVLNQMREVTDEQAEAWKEAVTDTLDAVGADESERLCAPVFYTDESPDEPKYPGEFPELNEATLARYTGKLRSTGAKNSGGYGVCMVTNEETDLVGTPPDPLGYSPVKQQGPFSRLDREQSWRRQPLSEDAALAMENSATFINACQTKQFELDVYYLPYPRHTMDAEDARRLYRLLYDIYEAEYEARRDADDDEGVNFQFAAEKAFFRHLELEREMGSDEMQTFIENLNIFLIGQFSVNSQNHTLVEAPNGQSYPPVRLARIHSKVESAAPNGLKYEWESWDSSTESILNRVLAGYYIQNTMPSRVRDGGDDPDPSAMSDRARFQRAVVTGESVDVRWLIEGYAERLISEWRDGRSADDDGEQYDTHVPADMAFRQMKQLEALASAGMLETNGQNSDYEDYTKTPNYMTENNTSPSNETATDADAQTETNSAQAVRAEQREADLQQFIEDRPALADNPERRSAFMMGVMAGMVSRWQERNGKGYTVLDHVNPTFGKRDLEDLHSKVLSLLRAYSREQNVTGLMYADMVREDLDAFGHAPVHEWGLSDSDMRLTFLQGSSYGETYYPEVEENEGVDDTDSEADVEAAQAD